MAAFVKNQDQCLVNKLAKNLQTVFEGMNIDGVKTIAHEKQQKLVIDSNEESPEKQSLMSPTADMLGD